MGQSCPYYVAEIKMETKNDINSATYSKLPISFIFTMFLKIVTLPITLSIFAVASIESN